MAFVVVGSSTSSTPCTEGFRCSGSNDTSIIRSADDSLSAGDTVFLTDGKFFLSSSSQANVNAGINFIGATGPDGRPATELWGDPGELRIVTIHGAASGVQRYENILFTGRTKLYIDGSNCRVSNCITRGRDTVFTGSNTFAWTIGTSGSTFSNIRLDRCGAVNTHNGGFQVLGTSQTNLTLSRCYAIECGLHYPRHVLDMGGGVMKNWSPGFSLEDTAMVVVNGLFDRCVAMRNYNSGFHIETDVAVTSCRFENCLSRGNGVRKYQDETCVQLDDTPGYCYWNAGFALAGAGTLAVDCVAIDNHRGYYLSNDANGASPKLYRCREVGSYIGYDADDGAVNPYMYRCVTERAKRTAVEGTNCTNFQVLELRRVPAGEGMVDISGTSTVTYAD